ncbi:serine/threonine protein kinase [Paenibacillus caui]|uniref:serine/threonine protein kinase n=1 Tax=Paenibacillus caui TaxID=2873927 RepID=UPI001CAA3B49
MTTSTDLALTPGTVIRGRWHEGRYIVKRLLGRGANGIVYLVQQEGGSRYFALKLGFDTVDLQSEINVLKTLQKQEAGRRGGQPTSYLVEVDDIQLPEGQIPFYVMRYVKGEPLSAFIARKGADWLDLAGLNVLRQLRKLHEAGWVFGDLKPDNIMAAPYGEVELIDYGGVSQIGRSVKQFTEWYDRGYWNAGSRTADVAYDWFAFSVVCIHLLAGDELKKAARGLPQTRTAEDLLAIVAGKPSLKPYAGWLKRAISGSFATSEEACTYWEKNICRRLPRKKGFATPGWLKSAFIMSLALLICALYWSLR